MSLIRPQGKNSRRLQKKATIVSLDMAETIAELLDRPIGVIFNGRLPVYFLYDAKYKVLFANDAPMESLEEVYRETHFLEGLEEEEK